MEISGLEFNEVGECLLDENLSSGVRFSLNKSKDDRVIYAFLVNDEVMYVGACQSSTTTLKDRMGRYQGMIGAGTNERIAELIKQALRENKKVKILAWKPSENRQYSSGLEIDMINGLENAIIATLPQKSWNIHK
ncbi:MAG: hypothetical protein J7K40_11685 [candidate division Zixibacteria bacterium]|nr:hypothetical protein [candidate division Zixibacteria bacterium]